MKIIKKIAAIMLSVMMVLGMCSVVGAVETSGKYEDGNGSITINSAIKDHPYTIYRILKLESFSGDDTDLKNGNYAYTVETGWDSFVNDTDKGGKYLEKDADGYVTWKTGADEKEFAKEALEYAKTLTTSGSYKETKKTTTDTLTFSALKLGYYLVDSSVGSLCFLGTTNKDVTILEKNGVPSVEKKVKKGSNYDKGNTASIGDKVEFQTTITAQPGAQNYVLHDKMSEGLTFDNSVVVKKNEDTTPLKTPDDYVLVTDATKGDDCTFHIEFKQDFCDTLKANDQIIITYSATLNESAVIAGEGNKNGTWLKYGESSETNHDTTTTKTYEIPVFKYANKGGADRPLANATFKLSKKDDGTDEIKIKQKASETNVYLVAPSGTTEITTDTTGKFKIQGLAAGTYYLTETQQPAGYNKLKTPLMIVIDENGVITYGSKSDSTLSTMPSGGDVKVLNNTGSILPSTGGMGTTLFYIFGAILVIGSGVVLITKKRMK